MIERAEALLSQLDYRKFFPIREIRQKMAPSYHLNCTFKQTLMLKALPIFTSVTDTLGYEYMVRLARLIRIR